MNIWAKLVWVIANSMGFCLAKMPHRLFVGHIKALAFIMRVCDRRRFRDAKANLDFVYGAQMSEEEKKHIIKTCYENFAFVLLETIRAVFIPLEKHTQRFSFVDEHYFLDTLKHDNGAVVISAHYGYWEAIANVLPPRYAFCNMASLGRLTPFDAINQMIIARREAQNVKFIDKRGAFKHLLKLYSKDNAVAGILVDQNISENEGVWIEFFGKRATHTTIASVLSRRFGVGIVPLIISINEDYKSFEVRYYPPIYCTKSKDSIADILEATQAQANVIENVIRNKPKDWFWFHKRWKSAYRDIYTP
ncbi:lipid A biosynthesis lauroyl acyltransferase [Helicobacter marmotae]|uniref:Lipid A biosynthesis lauroyl acyltransferase n=1 Tax=Helicobacter marmotae TaxID=152490 RepID=A0A3D8I363_9HELI|nr:lipid A biosynthesis lauroyl acyltransferase [Helicobacter marmotae]RDU59600.1 lipid A biosynthesis lauroyl acyltransferase [Helicobacter marmotae]